MWLRNKNQQNNKKKKQLGILLCVSMIGFFDILWKQLHKYAKRKKNTTFKQDTKDRVWIKYTLKDRVSPKTVRNKLTGDPWYISDPKSFSGADMLKDRKKTIVLSLWFLCMQCETRSIPPSHCWVSLWMCVLSLHFCFSWNSIVESSNRGFFTSISPVCGEENDLLGFENAHQEELDREEARVHPPGQVRGTRKLWSRLPLPPHRTWIHCQQASARACY